jgi:hypothetical protein
MFEGMLPLFSAPSIAGDALTVQPCHGVYLAYEHREPVPSLVAHLLTEVAGAILL